MFQEFEIKYQPFKFVNKIAFKLWFTQKADTVIVLHIQGFYHVTLYNILHVSFIYHHQHKNK